MFKGPRGKGKEISEKHRRKGIGEGGILHSGIVCSGRKLLTINT